MKRKIMFMFWVACIVAFMAGAVAGFLSDAAYANDDLLAECEEQHGAKRCVVIAIPANKVTIYQEF